MKLLLIILLVSISRALPAEHHTFDSAAGTIWTFENETWIENLAVRKDGDILATSLSRSALYLVNPFEFTMTTVHQFDTTDGLLGISEIQQDIFAVASANVSLATSVAYPGSAKMWMINMTAWEHGETDVVRLVVNLTDVGLPDGITTLPGESGLVLLADASLGKLWTVDTSTGKYWVVTQQDIFKPTNQNLPLGLDGIHIWNNFLYFTNIGSSIFGRVSVNETGDLNGPVEVIAQVAFPDDFCISKGGIAFIAGDNTIYRVNSGLEVEAFAGGNNNSLLLGATSAQLGRTQYDQHVLYVGTNGGILAPLNGEIRGGQIIAINTRQPLAVL